MVYLIMQTVSEWHYYGPETGSVEEEHDEPVCVCLSAQDRDAYLAQHDGSRKDIHVIEIKVFDPS